MSLTALRYEPVLAAKPRIDRKRNKIKPKTLLAHLEKSESQVRVLDLTNKSAQIPPVIVSKENFDYVEFCDIIENYMKVKGFTSFTLSQLPN